MRVKTDAKILLHHIAVLSSLAPSVSANMSLEVKNNNLHIYSTNTSASFQSIVPCDVVEGEAEFAVSVDAFKTLLKARDKVELQYINTMLVVSENGYKAELATTDAVELHSLKALKQEAVVGKKWKVSVDDSKWLKQACAEVNLDVVSDLSPFMPITMKITGKGAFVTCYDNNHMSFLQSKEMTGDLDVTMPANTIKNVLDAFVGTNFTMTVGDAALEIRNKSMKVSTSLPISDSYIAISDLLAMANKVLKSDHELLTVNRDSMLAFLDSCRAIATKERSELKIKSSGKKLNLQVKTITGNVNQNFTMQNSATCNFSLDFLYFEEAVKKASGEDIEIRVIKDSSILVGAKNGYTVISMFN